MSFFRNLSSAALMIAVSAAMLFAAEEDHTWSFSGDLYADRDTSVINIGVTNTVAFNAATIEIHFDTSKVTLVPYAGTSSYLLGRAVGYTLQATYTAGNTFLRFVLVDLNGVGDIQPGSGDILQVPFSVKEGVNIGDAVTYSLTRKQNSPVLISDTQIEVTGSPNAAPVFTDPGAQAATQGKRFSLQLRATDADGDALRYRLATSPGDGAKIDSVSGIFTWTPRQSGSATAVFEVTDGVSTVLLTVQFTVAQGNVAPVWTAESTTLQLQEGSVFTHTFDMPTDPNAGDVVTVTHGTLPGTATFNATSLTLSWTPAYDKAGRYEVVLTAADQAGLKSYHKVYLVVGNVNRAPALSAASSQVSGIAGRPLSFTVSASDPDRDVLTVEWTSNPAITGATLVNRVFNWAEAVAGQYTVTVTARDPAGLTAQVQVQLVVSTVNEAPSFGPVSDIRAEVGEAVQVDLTATDPDDDALIYELVLANETENILTRGATFAGGIFNWTPAASDAGPNLVTVRVDDQNGHTDEVSFTITVIAENVSAPVSFEAFGTQTVAEGAEIEFQLPISDAENFDRTALRFWAENLPVGAEWDVAAGTVTWTPGLQQAGTYRINCGVSDGNFEDIQQLAIVVTETDVDPVFTAVPSLEVDEGGVLSVVFEAVDSSSLEPLLFTAEGLPTGAVLYDLGQLYYQPDYDASGSYNVTITASDANDNTATESVTITVNDVNRDPEITAENQQVDEGQILGFAVLATDLDEDDVTLAVTGTLPDGAEFNSSTGAFVWTTAQGQSGNYEFEFTADDGNGGADSVTVIVTVGDVNQPPVIDPVGAVAVREGELVTITVVASDPDAGDQVTIAARNLPSGASLTQSGTNPATATIKYTPGYQRQGIYNIKLTATDNASEPLTSAARLKLEVQDVDVAPSFTGDLAPGTLRFEINEGETLDIDLAATDQGGDNVTVKVTNRPQGARIVRGNPDRLVYTPGYDVVSRSVTGGTTTRVFDMQVTASDGNQTVAKQMVIAVNDVNRAPRIPSIEDQVVPEGSLITFQVNATDPDGDVVTVSTAGRVPYLTAGDPPPARVRDGNVFIFDTGILPAEEIIRSAVFQFWAVDERGMVSDTVQVEIAISRETTETVPTLTSGNGYSISSTDGGFIINLTNGGTGDLSGGETRGTIISGLINLLFGGGNSALLASYAGEEKSKGVYAFTYLAGDLESQFYGIRRGWQLDLSTFSAGGDSLVAGADVAVELTYNDEDIPTEIPNFSEDRIKVFGFDAAAQVWVMADSQSVDTTTNTATFKLTNPQLVDYTIGAVLDVVAPVITDLKVTGGGLTVVSEGVDTLYNLEGSYQFKANVTDDEVLSGTDVTFYYAVGGAAFSSVAMERTGVNLFTASITEGALTEGTVISYYIEARDEMNVVLRPEGAPGEVYQLVLAEYTGTPGDLDGNISINIFDLLELLKVLGGRVEPSISSDVDQNGKTDIFDLLALLKLL